MRLMAILALMLVLGAGLGIAYVAYRQMKTDTMTLDGSPQFVQNGDGQLCADVDLLVEARTLGRWLLPVEEGRTITGVVAVQGDERVDIGLRILSPTNRLTLMETERKHRHEFQVVAPIRGAYTFEFDNRHSTFTEKQLTVSICLA